MDVPFHSSGALSRAHYAIVRKVESAPTVHLADQYVALEIKSLEAQLSHPRLSFDKCKECLVILLYCASAVTPGFLAKDAFDFAFSHAINLIEVSTKIEDKRLGYLFCSEVMPLDHAFRLMLINTLRKDLESEDILHICLALDNLITSPNEDIIPAVQPRLYELISHNHASVRRRTLFVFRALSGYNENLLDRIHGAVIRSVNDSDTSVARAALILTGSFRSDPVFVETVNDRLKNELSYANVNESTLISLLNCLKKFGSPPDANILVLLNVLQGIADPKVTDPLSKALLLAIFRVIGQAKPSTLIVAEKSRKVSIIQCIRHLLVSRDLIDVYLFVSCLEEVDVSIWAGTLPDHPATLRIIKKVDPGILETQISLLFNKAFPNTEGSTVISRILEITSIRYGQDGSGYAQQILDFIRHLDQQSSSPTQVIKEIIEVVLIDMRLSSKGDFVSSCVNNFVANVIDQEVPLGPTAMVIATALITEYLDLVVTPAEQLLSALATRLKSCPSVVQEPCLIALIRIRASCNYVPSDVVEAVEHLSRSGRKLVRLRCIQFQDFVVDKERLLEIVLRAQSRSLPDFLAALESNTTGVSESRNTTPQMSRSSSRASGPSPSLKYAAYALPEPTLRLSTRRKSFSQQSASSSRSGTTSDTHQLPTSLPITAGRLALADSLSGLHISQVERGSSSESKQSWRKEAEVTVRGTPKASSNELYL
uniref:Clathrin/coatomer adaptor adaptin-like N-terminal domain-containing protein n=1 Tax=Psilocybe cubensis TaxID=181762 RepID=A0A8H7Y844_PSICU